MNCEPGDLAVQIRSTCGNEGALVVVLAPAGDKPLPGCLAPAYEGHFLWHCVSLSTARETGGLVYPPGDEFAMPDAWLRPLRDPGDEARDETLDWLQVPTVEPVTADAIRGH